MIITNDSKANFKKKYLKNLNNELNLVRWTNLNWRISLAVIWIAKFFGREERVTKLLKIGTLR